MSIHGDASKNGADPPAPPAIGNTTIPSVQVVPDFRGLTTAISPPRGPKVRHRAGSVTAP